MCRKQNIQTLLFATGIQIFVDIFFVGLVHSTVQLPKLQTSSVQSQQLSLWQS